MQEKNLLYYFGYKIVSKHYDGHPIYHFYFKSVKTGKDVNLVSCAADIEEPSILGNHFYSNIVDATNDFDILWQISDDKISLLNIPYEEIRKDYLKMIKEGLVPSDINQLFLEQYVNTLSGSIKK